MKTNLSTPGAIYQVNNFKHSLVKASKFHLQQKLSKHFKTFTSFFSSDVILPYSGFGFGKSFVSACFCKDIIFENVVLKISCLTHLYALYF